jgi:hypothetical protein
VIPTARRLAFGSEGRPGSRLEWLVTNGLGGYACGTVRGTITRRYQACSMLRFVRHSDAFTT